jgi:type III pantothenate kinase
MADDAFPLVAVDVGNNRAKLAVFSRRPGESFPEPSRTCPLVEDHADMDCLEAWLAEGSEPVRSWWIASVNRPMAGRLIDWLSGHRPRDTVRLMTAGDLPLRVAVPRPDMVGIDRLLDAVAANRLRPADRAAIVVDVGSAITVDLVSWEGVFRGGAILPGISMSARALHAFTDLLPLIPTSELADLPEALGTSTDGAIRAGLFWGAVGSIRQLIEQLVRQCGDSSASVFLTGGAAPIVAELLGPNTRYVPHLTLAGIALAVQASTTPNG